MCLGVSRAGLSVCNAIAAASFDDDESWEKGLGRFRVVDHMGLLGSGREGLIADQLGFKREDMDVGLRWNRSCGKFDQMSC